MEEKKLPCRSFVMIWLGGGVSIAEILTGMLFAPLGFGRGMCAVIAGHVIGCSLLFLTGVIGAKTEESAMETVKRSFGRTGGNFFLLLNILQLVGWTAVMILSGSRAAAALSDVLPLNIPLWTVILGALIMLWVCVGVAHIDKFNSCVVAALFILTLFLAFAIFNGAPASGAPASGADWSASLSFGAALELSVAMPVSWLPLISDYTRMSGKRASMSAVSAVSYFISSTWMYFIGMSAAILTGKSEIADVMLVSGLGAAGIFIIIASTVTTTFLDAYSTGVCCTVLHSAISEKRAGAGCVAAGTVIALLAPSAGFEEFLYFIGSVFAPMCAIQLTDYFLLKHNASEQKYDWANFAVWLCGFCAYRFFLSRETVIGSTLPAMIITALLCCAKKLKGDNK